ncbi:ABC-2 transporter permease [Bifidobacterium animalis]|uniref:ABC-2 family transporter protein n=1 Tax=Bifidobacterium animalis subsp. lactis TaxID=302911 RepID=A0A8B3RIA8_BIFAN|nr:ABC-2 transporter permease [Bifidobacterium animalis]RYM94921.1 ABC-2 family transporter protein [Bifidobacterium animalis subsp. lactis]
MKGLFVRDAIWLGKQRMLLVCMLALTVFYLFSDLYAFGVAFLPLMLAMLVCRTVQNDVSRACRRMFFTMPFNTRDYLIEKYCGAIIPPMLLSLVLMALGTLSPQMAWNQVPVALVMVLATVSVTVAVEIPISLAFRDRAAVMRIVAMAVIFTICVLVVSVTNNQGILVALTSIPDGLLMLIGGVVCLVCTAASVSISHRLLSRAEW